jgi:Ca-activated chloride channel family protein
VNTQLLDRLGEAGRGDTDYVLPGENVERALSLLATKIQHPVLTDVELSARGFDVSEIYPVRIPDVFAGEELVLFGRFRGVGDGRISVEGRRSGGIEEFGTNVELSAAQDANDFIPRLWASRKLGHLERQVWTEGMSESLVDEIRAVALRYGLPSRYTSYLVQEPDVVAWQPMDPRGGGTGSSGSVARMQSAAPAVATGASAVKAAADARTMRSLASSAELEAAEDRMLSELLDQGASPRKALAGRLFELRDGVWTDLGVDEAAAELRVAPYSRAWFDLIGALPEVEPILRDMESVVIGGVDLTVYVEVEGVERLEPREVARIVAAFRGQG